MNEDVFAYSNRTGGERALVVYHNRYADAHGTIDFSAAYADKGSGQLRQRRLGEGLGLSGDRGCVVAWRDSITGLEYLRRAEDLLDRGLTLDLHAYQCHVFLDWRELRPTAEQPWDRLSDWLNGRGVPNLDDELVNLELKPVHDALRQLLDPGVVRHFADMAEHPRSVGAERAKKIERQRNEFLKQAWARGETFLRRSSGGICGAAQGRESAGARRRTDRGGIAIAEIHSASARGHAHASGGGAFPVSVDRCGPPHAAQPEPAVHGHGDVGPGVWPGARCNCWRNGSMRSSRSGRRSISSIGCGLREPFAHAFAALGFEGEEAWRVAARIKVLLLVSAGIGKAEEAAPAAKVEIAATETPAKQVAAPEAASVLDEKVALAPALWLDPDVRWLCGVHEAEGHIYLIRERYEELLWWLLMPSLLGLAGESAPSRRLWKS